MSMVSLGGSDWLGLGAIAGGLTQGTAECGSKPLSGDKTSYENCISNSLILKANQTASQEKKTKMKFIVIGLISVAVLITIVVVVKIKRK